MGVKQIQTEKTIEGTLMSLIARLNKLAPHPDHPSRHGPLFLSENLELNLPANTLGTIFAVADGRETVLAARAEKAGRAGKFQALSAAFSQAIGHHEMMVAYLRDLPQRLGLERQIADCRRKLHALRKQAQLQGLELAVA